MTNILAVIKRNTKIFVLAFVVCIALVFFVKNPNLFEASVLNIGEISFIEANKRDIAYKTTGNVLDIFVSNDLLNTNDVNSSLNISVAYDPAITLSNTAMESQTKYQIISSGDNFVNISIGLSSGMDYKKSLLMIPFSGSNNHILIQESYISTIDGKQKDLSVGNLTTQYLHN